MSLAVRSAAWALAVTLLAACAALQTREPLQVTVAGIEPMQGQGMELRMMVKLRVQNPNDAPVDYSGVSVKIEMQGNTFATGVSDESGSVPRFGESIVNVPVTASAMRMVRGALGMMGSKSPTSTRKVSYSLTGKLHGSAFSSVSFETKGDLELPTAAPAAGSET
jgi:LEA14-like dessication related protein